MRGSIPSRRSSAWLRGRVSALALAALLGACGFADDDRESHELRTSLHQSVTAASAMRPAAAPGSAPAAQALAIPATPDILRALTAGNPDELERLLGGLQPAYERGDVAQGRLWGVFGLFDNVIPGTLPAFDAWVARSPKSYAARLARGKQLAALGWDARGGKYARETPAENFREMRRLHARAADDLGTSLALAQRPFLSIETLMGIANGAGADEAVETLFDEGLRTMPKTFPLYRARMRNLEPRWGGSLEEMRDLVARAQADGLTTGEIAWLRTWVMLEENDGEIRSNPRAAVSFAVKATEMDDRAPRWLHRSRVERGHGFRDEALASVSRAIELDPGAYEGWADRGYVRELRGELADARSDYDRGARLGSYYAQERMISLYVHGELGVKRDYALAREWCELAAAMSNPQGDFCIGGLYFDGLGGVSRDHAEAFKWFRRAAGKGHATGQHDVGWMLVQGKGVAPNRDEGIEWLRKAARQDHQYAKEKLQQLGVPAESAPGPLAMLRRILFGR